MNKNNVHPITISCLRQLTDFKISVRLTDHGIYTCAHTVVSWRPYSLVKYLLKVDNIDKSMDIFASPIYFFFKCLHLLTMIDYSSLLEIHLYWTVLRNWVVWRNFLNKHLTLFLPVISTSWLKHSFANFPESLPEVSINWFWTFTESEKRKKEKKELWIF